MSTPDRLREQRKRVGLSLGQVAEYEGISKSYLSDLERGENAPPTWPLLAKLARRYRTNADYLLGNTNYLLPIEDRELSPTVVEVMDIMSDLSPSRQEELLAHARVLAEAERDQDVREYDRMMALILALPGGETLASEIEDALRADAAGDAATALRLIDDIVARWRGRTAHAELSEQQVEPG